MAQTLDEDNGTAEKKRTKFTARSVLHAVKRRPLTLIGVVLLAAGAGAAVWFFLPLPKSTAAVVFHVAPSRPAILNPEAGGDGNAYRQSQAAFLKQRLTLSEVLKQTGIQQLEVIRKQPDALAWLDYHLKVEVRPNNDFIRVTLEGDNPEEQRIILDALSRVYLKGVDDRDNRPRRERLDQLEKTHKGYSSEVELIHKRIDTIALALGSKDGEFLALRDSYMKKQYQEAQDKLREVSDKLRDLERTLPAENDPNALDPALPGMNGLPPAPMPDGPAVTDAELDKYLQRFDLVFRGLETDVVEARKRLTELQGQFQEGARPLVVTQAEDSLKTATNKRDKYRAERRPEIEAEIQKQTQEAERVRLTAARAARDRLKGQVASAQATVTAIETKMEKANEYRLELENLKGQIEQKEKFRDSLAETIERLKVELGAKGEVKAPDRVTLADEAYVVAGLEGNRRLKFALLSIVGVLGVGFVAVVGWEHRARRFTDTQEVSTALGIRLLGTVPIIGREPREVSATHPVLIEAIDATRTLLVHGADQPDLRVLVVTSAVSGEGKTSLTGHLAISLARAGFRTLLVDGDLRSPTAQRVFDLPLGPGLCELLEERVTAADAVRSTGIPGLSVLTAGQWTAATRQALVGERWRVTKDQLKAEFDYILVDTSPLLLVSDALLLAREADGVVVSVLLGVSQVALVEEAVTRLQAVRARLSGVIASGARNVAHQYTHGYGGKPAAVVAADTVNSGR